MHYIYAKTREEKTKFSMSKKGVRMMSFKLKNDVKNLHANYITSSLNIQFRTMSFPSRKTQERQHVFHSFKKPY